MFNCMCKPVRFAIGIRNPLVIPDIQWFNFMQEIPLERVHLDFIGPLPKTLKGNEHILMIVDQFTKWVECIPLPSQTAEETARAAVNEFFCRFGFPFQVHTDQGLNFESSLFQQLCKMTAIHKTRTTAYRPSTNGQVERYNRTLMDAVRWFIGQAQNNWDQFLPQIASAIRATVNRSTGFTPNRLMLGREVNQPANLMFPLPLSQQRQSPDEYCRNLSEAMRKAHDTARNKLKSTQARVKRDHDVKVNLKSFKMDDWVYFSGLGFR